MVDTLRLGAFVGVDVTELEARGWTVTEVRKPSAPPALAAQCTTAERVRCQVWAMEGGNWAALEASLPRLVHGENASLLQTWAEVEAAARCMLASAEAAAGAPLPPLEGWTVRRIDAVHAWEYPAAPYLAALTLASMPRCTPSAYPTGRRWQLPGGGIAGRAYDKGAEVGRAVALPLRVERQARPARNVVKVDGQEVGLSWASWGASEALGMVRAMLADLGLDMPVQTPLAARARLVEAHGERLGRNVFRVMLEAREVGGWHAVGVDSWTRQRYRRLAAAAGIKCLSDVELPALAVP